MALRGAQDKQTGMYDSKLNIDISSSKVSSSAPAINSLSAEKRIDQTLNHKPTYNPVLNPNSQIIERPPDTDPWDTANRSRLKPPQQQPPTAAPPPVVGDPTTAATTPLVVRYRECLKNHAVNMGGHVVDGCGEFMPSGGEDGVGGGPEALKCAACECHRNFHRKEEVNGETQYAPPPSCYNYTNNNINPNNNIRRETTANPPPPPPLHQQRSFILPTAPVTMNFRGGGGDGGAAESSSEDLNVLKHSNYAGGGPESSLPKKRFRTKFSEEQKEKMMEFSRNLGWRIRKEDDVQVQQFCGQVGVKRKVFKVWMHNNRQAMKKKQM